VGGESVKIWIHPGACIVAPRSARSADRRHLDVILVFDPELEMSGLRWLRAKGGWEGVDYWIRIVVRGDKVIVTRILR
jgi:uncharacterized protein YaiI (UPF0178 family)